MVEDDATVHSAIAAGAVGYLLKGADGEDILAELTDRERLILDRLAAGLSNVEIGRGLFSCPRPWPTTSPSS